ncbi:MAG: UDP-N-acetylmuramate dehydrogenase [Bacteroidota bacterium]|nr:UDP-N-acetylmuramate dehydrogenase [Bacteroidota bacterium]
MTTSLKNLNTFGIEVFTDNLIHIFTQEQLIALIQAKELSRMQPFFILGGGSNVLFTQDWKGSVLLNEIKGISHQFVNENTVCVTAGSGVLWHDLVIHTLSNNWGGLQNLSLIYGSVGAAPMQNIGAYGVEIKDCFNSLTAVHIASGDLKEFSAEQCKFGYRESVFKHELKGEYFITAVSFNLTTDKHSLKMDYGDIKALLAEGNINRPSIQDISNAVIQIRQSKLPDPAELGNAGSFFKNPEIDTQQYLELKQEHPDMPGYELDNGKTKVPAGWLIEQTGWKGKRIGNTGCHAKQALVLVNYGDATGTEIFELAKTIIDSIHSTFGIKLSPEVNVI